MNSIFKLQKNERQVMAVAFIVATIIFLLLSLTGCATGGVYDPIKTAKVQAVLKPLVSTAVRAEVTAQPQNAQYIRSIGNIFCQMQTNGDFSPKYLVAEANKLTAPLVRDEVIFILRDSIIALYEINYADRFRAELAPDKWPMFIAELLCGGINAGLAAP